MRNEPIVNIPGQSESPKLRISRSPLQSALRGIIDARTILQALNTSDLSNIGVTSQLHGMVSRVIESIPELKEGYARLKADETLVGALLSAATLGYKPTPAQRFVSEVYKAVDNVVEQLSSQGLVHVSILGAISCMPISARTAASDGPPLVVTTISITEAGRRALEESSKVKSRVD